MTERNEKYRYALYKASGEELAVSPQVKKNKFTLDEMQRMVGGSIEFLNLGSGHQRFVATGGHCGPMDECGFCSASMSGGLVRDGWVLIVNEEGRLRNLPVNKAASELWGNELVGDVLLCRSSAID